MIWGARYVFVVYKSSETVSFPFLALRKGLRIPEFEKFLLLVSEIPDFGIRNTAQVTRKPNDDLNPESEIHGVESRIQDCLGWATFLAMTHHDFKTQNDFFLI